MRKRNGEESSVEKESHCLEENGPRECEGGVTIYREEKYSQNVDEEGARAQPWT
jgi:hypothetical protein